MEVSGAYLETHVYVGEKKIQLTSLESKSGVHQWQVSGGSE